MKKDFSANSSPPEKFSHPPPPEKDSNNVFVFLNLGI